MRISSPATFDIDALLHQIPGERPGGDPRAYARGLRTRIAELRNPPRPANPEESDSECVDWTAITVVTTEALVETTKDLRVACHLTEAAMQHWGVAGLRDGVKLLRRMVELFWDDLAPELDPDDLDARCSPLENLLNDPNRGPRLPSVLRSLPILDTGVHQFSLMTATRYSGEMGSADVASAVRDVSVQDACRLSDDVDEATAELESFQQAMIDRMGEYAPSFVHLQESLSVIRQWLDNALKPQFESRDIIDAEEAPMPLRTRQPAGAIADSIAVVDQSQQLRAQAYQQLTNAASTLMQIEPHSPIPYMVRRAVQLGELPFPDLMVQLVKEESTLEMFHRELGLAVGETRASMDDD